MVTKKSFPLARFGAPILCMCALFASFPAARAQNAGLSLQVFTSGAGSLNANFTLIYGATGAVLVDVPFLRSDAYRLAADVLDSGKTIEKIFVTHNHPDHMFGLDVLHEAFPDAEVIAAPEVAAEFWVAFPDRYSFWEPQIGSQAPRYPYPPKPYEASSFMLEGHEIQILGPMVGDAEVSTALYVPSLDAIIAGDIVFDDVYPYTESKALRQAWVETLDRLSALEPAIVVAGHARESGQTSPEALQWTRDYLIRFEQAVEEANSAEELAAIMSSEYPDAMDFVGGFILTTSSATAMAEKLDD